jgi:hypothetical protein
VRSALIIVVLASSAWANPPVAPKSTKPIPVAKSEPAKRPEAKPLEHHVETKRADAASSTLSLATPKKRPARHVSLPDWTP